METTTLLRAAGETLGTLFYVIALARMPIAGVVAILQTAPLILILGAAALLGERIGGARVALPLRASDRSALRGRYYAVKG